MNGYEIALITIACLVVIYAVVLGAIELFKHLQVILKTFKTAVNTKVWTHKEFITKKSEDKQRVIEAKMEIVKYRNDLKVKRLQERLLKEKTKKENKSTTLDEETKEENKESTLESKPEKKILLEEQKPTKEESLEDLSKEDTEMEELNKPSKVKKEQDNKHLDKVEEKEDIK